MKTIKVRSKLKTTNAAGETFYHRRNRAAQIPVLSTDEEVLDFLELFPDATWDRELSHGKEYYTVSLCADGKVVATARVCAKKLRAMFG